MWQRVSRYLLASETERDPLFQHEIARLSHLGLRVIAGVTVAVAAFMMLARFLVAPDPETMYFRLMQAILAAGAGAVFLAVSYVPSFFRWARVSAFVCGLTVAAIVVWFSLLMTAYEPTADDFIPGQFTLIMLVGVSAIPYKPFHTLLFGIIAGLIYISAAFSVDHFYTVGSGVEWIFVAFIVMLTLLATGLTAVVYEQRRTTFEALQNTLQAAEGLRKAEARNLLAQNAASVGRLAAALSHELNSPIGVLVSGVDTLLLLAGRQANAAPSEVQRLIVLQADLRKSIKASTDRLREIVALMQRFTNLDKAEIQSANINEILGDVAALLESRARDKALLEIDFNPVPQLICRPQQLSAVFSSLLGNAIDAVNGDGRVVITTRHTDTSVEIVIQDNGQGMDRGQLDHIFDPGFKVTRGRVSTGNWNMFSSRQIVIEHGGDIQVDSAPGKGTRVRVSLPCDTDPSSLRLN